MRSRLVARALFGEAFKMGFEKVCVISVSLALLDFQYKFQFMVAQIVDELKTTIAVLLHATALAVGNIWPCTNLTLNLSQLCS